jgi:hypothetical protein
MVIMELLCPESREVPSTMKHTKNVLDEVNDV